LGLRISDFAKQFLAGAKAAEGCCIESKDSDFVRQCLAGLKCLLSASIGVGYLYKLMRYKPYASE